MTSNVVKTRLTTATGVISSQTPVTLANTQTVTIYGPNRLDSLEDVVANTELDGGVLVYDATIDKYVVEVLSANQVPVVPITVAPANNETGTVGQMLIDGNYLYICVANNAWKRTALTSY